jgi:type IV fimbrial biogenesis protein FimT
VIGRNQHGLTLYELLASLLVAGIVAALGAPNLLEFSRNSAMSSTANDMITALLTARSEAVKQRSPITFCASLEPLAPLPSCSPDAFGTAGGYIVWADDDRDAVVDGSEQLILQREFPEGIVVTADRGYIAFGVAGYVEHIAGLSDSASAILLCDRRGNAVSSGSLSAARVVRVDRMGRGQVLREVAEIRPIVAALGAPCT